jgi:hypothetical protein
MQPGTFVFLKPKKSIPANAEIHDQLAQMGKDFLFGHYGVVLERFDVTITVCFIFSFNGRPLRTGDRFSDRRMRHRLIEFPGVLAHDGLPALKLKEGQTARASYVSVAEPMCLHVSSFGTLCNFGEDRRHYELEGSSLEILRSEVRRYATMKWE